MTMTKMKNGVRTLAACLILAALALATAQSGSATAQATAITQAAFYSGHPGVGGELVARMDVAAAAEANVEGAEYVVLESADHVYVFALASQAQAEGQVRVVVEHAEAAGEAAADTAAERSAMALAEVAARLEAAMRGETTLAVFTEGHPESGRVIGMFRINANSGNVAVTLDSATHAVLFANGDAEVLEVRATGDTLAEIEVAAEGESGARGVVELGTTLDLGGSASSDDGGAEGSADVGVGVGVGVGGDGDDD